MCSALCELSTSNAIRVDSQLDGYTMSKIPNLSFVVLSLTSPRALSSFYQPFQLIPSVPWQCHQRRDHCVWCQQYGESNWYQRTTILLASASLRSVGAFQILWGPRRDWLCIFWKFIVATFGFIDIRKEWAGWHLKHWYYWNVWLKYLYVILKVRLDRWKSTWRKLKFNLFFQQM